MNKPVKPTNGAQDPVDERPDDVTDNNLEDGLEELEAAEEAAAEATQAKRDEESDEEDDKKKALEYEEDPRADIEEQFFDKRADKDEPADADEETEPKQAQDNATEDPDEEITAKVDGKIEKITRAELERRLAEYQRYGTAEKRLQEASELLKQAKELKSAAPQEPTGDNTESKTDTSTKDSGESVDDLLAKVGEKLQFGDANEVVEALKTVIEQAQRGRPDAPQVTAETVTRTVLEVKEQERSQEALKTFETENADLNENPRLQTLVRHEISDIMRNDIREVARTRGYSQEEIDQIDTLSEPELVQAHRAMRVNNIIARDTGAVLRQAKDNLVKANLWPSAKPASPAASREERKQSAMQQPASRTHTAAQQSQQRRTAVQTVADIVAEEQQARGNPGL